MSPTRRTIKALHRFVSDYPRLLVLSGAGISIASGIPAYRDSAGVWQHSAPITHQEFVSDAARRQRYWARSALGWPAVRDARPNEAHLALAQLERLGHVRLLITQNVDRLHQRAGSAAVMDLHGRVDRVRCMACDTLLGREQLQLQLLRDNPDHVTRSARIRPDGDSDLADALVQQFAVPACARCSGVLIPDVTFFGGTVPPERVETCTAALSHADALLAVGSSLQVYSGFRFCRLARKLGKPIAIINPGTTRADPLADLKLPVDCAPLLTALVTAIKAGREHYPCAVGSPS